MKKIIFNCVKQNSYKTYLNFDVNGRIVFITANQIKEITINKIFVETAKGKKLSLASYLDPIRHFYMNIHVIEGNEETGNSDSTNALEHYKVRKLAENRQIWTLRHPI